VNSFPPARARGAAIFDCDGTLVDSEPLAWAAWRAVLDRRGYAVTEDDVDLVTGRSYAMSHAHFAERAGLPEPEPFWGELSAELFAMFEDRLRPFDDAAAAVRELAALGVPLAVASSSPRERLDRALAVTGFTPRFVVTVAGDEVEHAKPAPDIFLVTAQRLGVAPERCVVIEDTRFGVEAGLAAGMATIAVAREPGHEELLGGADIVTTELRAEHVLALLGPG
jgi:HAD superfamily hydrolase (TIGR01509 family)